MTETNNDAKISSLGYALLSLLARRDRSGYELSLFTSPPRNHLLWSAGHSQVYPELAKLTALGLIDYSEVPQSSRPDKKVYTLLPQGMERLREWVLRPPKPTPFRSELHLKSHSSWIVDPADAAAFFRAHAEAVETEIELIEQHRDTLAARYDAVFPPPADDPLFGTYANIKFAVDSRRQLIDWCRWMDGELLAAAEGRKKKRAV